jgi:hypothetical protein
MTKIEVGKTYKFEIYFSTKVGRVVLRQTDERSGGYIFLHFFAVTIMVNLYDHSLFDRIAHPSYAIGQVGRIVRNDVSTAIVLVDNDKLKFY